LWQKHGGGHYRGSHSNKTLFQKNFNHRYYRNYDHHYRDHYYHNNRDYYYDPGHYYKYHHDRPDWHLYFNFNGRSSDPGYNFGPGYNYYPWYRTETSPYANLQYQGAGNITIHVDPFDAEVFVDGWALQRHPQYGYMANTLTGNHRVEIRKVGFKPYFQDFNVAAGANHDIEIRLEKFQ